MMAQKKTWKELVIGFQQGGEQEKEELMKKFAPLIYSLSHCTLTEVSRDDLVQDLWLKFMESTMNFDAEKADFFPACIAKKLKAERISIIRRMVNIHKREGRSLESVKEEVYEMSESKLWPDQLKELLEKCGWSRRQVEVALSFTEDLTPSERRKKLHMTQQGLHKWKKKLAVMIMENPEIKNFLGKQVVI